jgi:hypothetical protein
MINKTIFEMIEKTNDQEIPVKKGRAVAGVSQTGRPRHGG